MATTEGPWFAITLVVALSQAGTVCAMNVNVINGSVLQDALWSQLQQLKDLYNGGNFAEKCPLNHENGLIIALKIFDKAFLLWNHDFAQKETNKF